MPSSCIFEFNRRGPIYYSGEVIKGRIRLRTTNEKTCDEIYIRLHGYGKTYWRERKHYYREEETYINTNSIVFSAGRLPPGVHTYNFSIPLPIEAPSTCVGKYGHIKYEISLIIDRPFRFDNVFGQQIVVLKTLNLNLSPQYLIPLQGDDIQYSCCSSNPVISTLQIPFGGYVPGQILKYKILIENRSSNHVGNTCLELIQTVQFLNYGLLFERKKYQVVTLVSKLHNETVSSRKTRILNGTILIPSVPATSVNSGIIRVGYLVRLYIKTGECSDSRISIPITIGTVPLAQSITNPLQSSTETQPSAPTLDTQSNDPNSPLQLAENEPSAPTSSCDPDPPPSYNLLKPPSFDEAISITNNSIDTDVAASNGHNTPDAPLLCVPPPGDDLSPSST